MRLALIACLLPSLAFAESYPSLHAVIGVALDDVLNIRDQPSPEGAIIGTLAPDAMSVEVLRVDESGRWARVNSGEQAGWAALRFLSPMPEGALPERAGMACGGTEPFWGLDVWQGETVQFESPEEAWSVDAGVLIPAQGRSSPWVLLGEGDGRAMTAVIEPELCTDGMSDREYGLSITLVSRTMESVSVYEGCCLLDAN